MPALKSNLILAWDKDYVYSGTNHYGMEVRYKEIVGVRLGYYDKNITSGLSVKLYGIYVDYAFVTNVLGGTNRLGLRVNL